ncbi:DUF4179 domain-containing protein [Neobacillus kokaensis]|uniref:DUF4179 domain-containing protein n=1 Tax=Neobacillus kokaensis TaxID=2759023 RepID=A0ABQ3N9V0_9BACI|nr:DUF4030 domain-containing protein [Neobacillus kokaensis]GHI00688.1 hypothetical protein AM1BK_42300 [Neobacillus kokaensis]
MASNREEMKPSLDELQVPVSLERFTKKLSERYREGEFDEDRIERVNQEWNLFEKSLKKQSTLRKKVVAIASTAAASFLILAGSGFVSPAMAKMMGKIPTLSAIYDRFDENLSDLITRELKKEGYPVKEVREHVGGKKEGVYVYLDVPAETVNKMKPGIEKISFAILHGEKYKGTRYEDYYVRVRKFVVESEEWKKQQAQIEKKTKELFDIVKPVLDAHGYNQVWGGGPETIELEFPNTEKPEKINEIKKAVEEKLKAAGEESVKVKYRIFNLAKEQQYNRWSGAVSGIASEFKTYKKYKVSSVGYKSLKGEKMQIHISIKLKSTDPKAAQLAKDLKSMAEDFIHTEEIWNKVKDDPYEIIITSKDKKRME